MGKKKNKFDNLLEKFIASKDHITLEATEQFAISALSAASLEYNASLMGMQVMAERIMDLEKENKEVSNVEYNRKVKIPQFIKNTMDLYDGLPYMLADEYYNGSTEEVDSDVIQCWIEDNFELLCRAWLDGYEVEEEPKYYVCVPYAGSYYWKTGSLINPIGTATGNNTWTLKNCEFTQKEIDELLPDVEKFKIPVEEVNHE